MSSSDSGDLPNKATVEEIEKGSTVHVSSTSKDLTRKVLWKLDTRILPILAVLFLCSFLDRTNVGNAKLYNLEADLGITNHQYDQGLAVFYATYILSEIPSNLILKKLTPQIWLPCLTFLWGVSAMCLGFVQNFAGFVGVLYLSTVYTRGELALRIGIFYTAASLSGAFGGMHPVPLPFYTMSTSDNVLGLLARGIAEIGTRGGLNKWRWIFVIEGLFTAIVGIAAYFILPNGVGTARFLNEEEREFAVNRLNAASQGDGSNREKEVTERFSWSEVGRGVFSLQTWFTAAAYFGILSGLYSFGLFLPTIITGLGYTADEAQLWSVIPYAVASVVTVITAFISDRFRVRGIVMLCSLPLAIIGYGVIANIDNNKVKYGMTFLMATGLYSSVPPVLGWLSNNSAGHYKRATTSALQLAIANCGGFVAVFIYPKAQEPAYHKGHTVILGVLCAGWFLILCNVLYCWKINRDKANGKYDKYRGFGDDRDPTFKLVL
ncbi:hypothetical protein Daesc_003713 [Daldinia eschscholtzii]|uniref:Major facilitator superfamily (MFS) profile domain-containing protein n=1 Tax=Daldinia eschscholtzii TaxID=292717 RepID=A0AAX6MNJ1_9PEZI